MTKYGNKKKLVIIALAAKFLGSLLLAWGLFHKFHPAERRNFSDTSLSHRRTQYPVILPSAFRSAHNYDEQNKMNYEVKQQHYENN